MWLQDRLCVRGGECGDNEVAEVARAAAGSAASS